MATFRDHGADYGDEVVPRTNAADRTKAAERVLLGDNHQAADLLDPLIAPRVEAAGSDGVDEKEPLGLGDAAAHHGGDANANNDAPETRLAADLPARRWSASLLRGARFVLSPVADGVFHLTLYVLESPMSRFVGHLVRGARELGHGMLAFAALVAMAARPRAADHGGLDVGTEGLHERDAAAALAALLGAGGGHADHDEEVGADEDRDLFDEADEDHDEDDAAGAALGAGEDDLFDEEPPLGDNADPEARLAAEFPARRWSAAMLRGARELLSVAADGVLHGVLYVVESPISRLVADLVPELRDLGHGMLALATLLALAARPRALGGGGEDADAGDQDLAAEEDPAIRFGIFLLAGEDDPALRFGVFIIAAGAFYGVF